MMKIEFEDHEDEGFLVDCPPLRSWLVLVPESPVEELALAKVRDGLDRRHVEYRRIGLTQLAVRLHN
jgi:hypothetical protein